MHSWSTRPCASAVVAPKLATTPAAAAVPAPSRTERRSTFSFCMDLSSPISVAATRARHAGTHNPALREPALEEIVAEHPVVERGPEQGVRDGEGHEAAPPVID